MKLKGLKDIDLKSKRILLRVAYDVPLIKKGAKWIVADDARIRASLPTLKVLLRNKCRIIITTWLGRPGGRRIEKYALDPVAKRLSELLKHPVKKVDACTGPGVNLVVSKMKPRDIVMLENVRFFADEENRKPEFARKLSTLADAVVFDAFAQSHRDVPSTTGILSLLPSVAGINMQDEVKMLSSLLQKPKAPFVVVLGGAKISDKVEALEHLLPIADVILVGGAMAHNFLKARGIKIGNSFIEDDPVEHKRERQRVFTLAEDVLEKTKDTFFNMAEGMNVPKLVLPLDLVAARDEAPNTETAIIDLDNPLQHIHRNWMYLDIGPKTIEYYAHILSKAKTIFWNGPLGYVEMEPFERGSKAIALSIAKCKARTILGGGDTEGFVRRYRMQKKYDYISTGGGASIEFLSGKVLPVLPYLMKE